MSSFRGLSIGISGLYANKRSLDTISHNISNADNPLYVRQQAIHSESRYSRINVTHSLGTGVDVQQIRQIRDEFLDSKIRKEASEFGFWLSSSNVFGQIEGIVGELSEDALQGVMDKFWNTWEEVAKDPSSLTVRGLLRERAIEFVGTVNHMYEQLESLQFNLDKNIRDMVDEVNQLVKGIGELNTKIMAAEAMGSTANDYRDTRNGYLDRLSQIIKVDIYTSNNGAANVVLGGRHIVSDGNFRQLDAKNNGSPFVDIHWADTGEKLSEERDIRDGELLGLIYARGYYDQEKDITDVTEYKYIIPTLKKQLDEYVKGIAEAVNKLHRQGYTLTGKNDNDFFVNRDPSKSTWAGNIKISDAIDSLSEIAVSAGYIADTEPREIGDGKIAEAIAKLRYGGLFTEGKYEGFNIEEDLSITFLGKTTTDNFYRDIITDFGIAANKAVTMKDSHEMVMNHIDDKRISLSGVSLDEEMTEMIKFQHAYNANARLINAIDEMIEQIVNRMGVVGR